MILQRTYWFVKDLDSVKYVDAPRTEVKESEANLVASLLPNGNHAPTLDIDMPARLVPSTTKDHYHLYIEHELTWRQYRRLLKALYKAGLIQRGFFRLSVQRKATFVRKPGVLKGKNSNGYGR